MLLRKKVSVFVLILVSLALVLAASIGNGTLVIFVVAVMCNLPLLKMLSQSWWVQSCLTKVSVMYWFNDHSGIMGIRLVCSEIQSTEKSLSLIFCLPVKINLRCVNPRLAQTVETWEKWSLPKQWINTAEYTTLCRQTRPCKVGTY